MKCFWKWMMGYGIILALTLLTAHWCSSTVTVMAEHGPFQRSATVILDAGHGGPDGGAISCTGKSESSFNLEICLRLRELFHFLGRSTTMIRTEDISVYTKGETLAQKKMSDLKQRAKVVNDTENGIVLSIHQNMFSDSRYSGAQVFYGAAEGSRELADALQLSFGRYLQTDRQAKRSSGVYLMEHIERPGILIECGFLSNPQEERLLRSADYQKKLSAVIACCVSEYLSNT